MLLNAANCQRYSFYYILVIKGRPTEAERKLIPAPPKTKLFCPGIAFDLSNRFISELEVEIFEKVWEYLQTYED